MSSIKCANYVNASCIKCHIVSKYMVKVGAFVMCKECWKQEFNKGEIDAQSDLYKVTYHKWLEKYMKQ